jgi:hypothetical protein
MAPWHLFLLIPIALGTLAILGWLGYLLVSTIGRRA